MYPVHFIILPENAFKEAYEHMKNAEHMKDTCLSDWESIVTV